MLLWQTSYGQEFVPKEECGLKYQLLDNTSGEASHPLIVYLHGRSGCGDDNTTQMQQPAVRKIADYITQEGVKATLLVPQCPSEFEWAQGRELPGCYERVIALVKRYVAKRGVEPSRIYLYGISMGAVGVWRILADEPTLFAGAIIGSGLARGVEPSDYINTPLSVTVGSEERSCERLYDFTNEIKRAGGTIDFTVFDGYRHGEACEAAFSARRLKWLFEQRRAE